MIIDEAIAQEKEMARTFETKDFSEYHEQLAEWLEELKTYRECNVCEYNKAIDDFVNQFNVIAEQLKAEQHEW